MKLFKMAILFILLCYMFTTYAKTFKATNSVYLDRENTVMFRWAYTESTIKFEVTMPTTGWVGIGFSPSGRMTNSDVILGWMRNAQPRVLDMHATGRRAPIVDAKQNLRHYTLKQNGTHTILFVDRYLDTCDRGHDYAITEDTTRVIFAFGDTAPGGILPVQANYHGQNRGVKSLRLLDKKLPVLTLEDDAQLKYFDIRVKPFTIPNRTWYYLCSYHKFPVFQQKQHMVQFKVMVTPGNEKNLHHIMMYHCNESMVTDEMLNKREQCYVNDEGSHWKYCTPVVVAWAIGMTEITVPNHVGFPLGTAGSPKVVKLEIHYDNAALEKGIVDTSGVRIFHTTKLRRYDAGVMLTGHDVTPFLFVPPQSKNFIVHGHCTEQCLKGVLKRGGVTHVNIFGVFMHSHTAGRKMILRHYRNGTELPPIAKDLTYDFDYQESKLLSNEKVVQSGDNVIMECVYDTSGRSLPTTGGLRTKDEMCFGFVMYYPKLDDAFCAATPTSKNMYKYFGVRTFKQAYDAARNKKWTDYTRKEFNDLQLSSPLWELCRTISGPIQGLKQPYGIPAVTSAYTEDHQRCWIRNNREEAGKA